ncbi:MAG: ABC transporter, partial [Asticcacaulis sp.]|nr:ABC transporter [Asticcacaulis sp.]
MADSVPAPHTSDVDPKDRPGSGAELVGDIRAAAARRGKTRDLRPLTRLAPYLWRQRVNGVFMLVFLVISAS